MTDAQFEHPLLLDAADFRDHLDHDNVVVLDATTFLDQPEGDGHYTVNSGRTAYEAEHIPGAVHADLHLELADQDSDYAFTVLDSATFAERIGALGIADDSHVLIYDHGQMMWATRLWWNLRLEGHDRISILDGGLPAWKAADFPVAVGVETNDPATFTPRRRDELLADVDLVKDSIVNDDVVLINSLDLPTYTGERKTYERAGHIPSSVNVPFQDLLTDEGTAAAPEQVRKQYEAVGALDEGKTPITYCGGGIAATLEAFQLARLGRDDVAVYDGSMTEWAADHSLPLEAVD